MEIDFECPRCGRKLSVDVSMAGYQFKCPQCFETVTAPLAEPVTPGEGSGDTMFCPKCGQKNLANNYRCTRCGFILHGPPQAQYVAVDDGTLGGLIPHKNPCALWAYYLGVFSLIPCLGLPLGIAALVLGIKGLKFARQNPDTQGKVHAWIGIVLGSLCALANILLPMVSIIIALRAG